MDNIHRFYALTFNGMIFNYYKMLSVIPGMSLIRSDDTKWIKKTFGSEVKKK